VEFPKAVLNQRAKQRLNKLFNVDTIWRRPMAPESVVLSSTKAKTEQS